MKPVFRGLLTCEDWAWINARLPIHRCEDTGGIVAVDSVSRETLAMCVFDNKTQNSVQVHLVIDKPLVLKHGFMHCCCEVMFNVLGVSRLYGLVPANNEKAVKLNTHLGFTVKAVLDEAYAVGVDYLVMEWKRENCSFLHSAGVVNG
jgi:RimJ/RimL family protein N-acetyltransferase